MPGVGSLLSIARTAIHVQQTAIEVTSHNVANADTEGYSRQRVDTRASYPVYFAGLGHVGTGVDAQRISRARNDFLDATFRKSTGQAAFATTSHAALGQVEEVLGEPSADGLASALDAFWGSWSDVAANPTSQGAKGVVVQRGEHLAATLNQLAAQLDTVSTSGRARVQTEVAEINQLTAQVAQLNRDVVAGESAGASANDLRDARDSAIDRLAALTGAESIEQPNGSVMVYVAGHAVVDGTSHAVLAVRQTGTRLDLVMQKTGTAIELTRGSLGASQGVVNTHAPRVMERLDAIAMAVFDGVNGIHQGKPLFIGDAPRIDANGDPVVAGQFFAASDPAPAIPGSDFRRTARGIGVDTALTADASRLAVAGAGATGSGNVDTANALATFRDRQITFMAKDGATPLDGEAQSVASFYARVVADLGLAVRGAERTAAASEALASNADMRRQSVSGVSTDEELANLIQLQQAFQAAARLITVADEMARTVVELGR